MPGFAWVTLATNDSYSLGALVLAHSLRRVGTKHELAVLITPGVTQSMREKLSSVFNVVQEVNVLDSKDEANLALLARPELGITFTKLHCWRLTQYDKCVFVDADTLVVKNCDELFEREELSAAPDVGWPDCFNSGVFVFKPSQQTFASITAFASSKGSFDGGDQGLLNMYFSDWAHKDISKHLPFIYNVCSTATYSYLPAFKQYGEDVRIIHFIGVAKPWLQYFDTLTGIVQPPPGANHLQPLLQIWWNIFCDNVHPSLSDAMASGNSGTHWQYPVDPETWDFPIASTLPPDFSEFRDPWDDYTIDNKCLLLEDHETVAVAEIHTGVTTCPSPPHTVTCHIDDYKVDAGIVHNCQVQLDNRQVDQQDKEHHQGIVIVQHVQAEYPLHIDEVHVNVSVNQDVDTCRESQVHDNDDSDELCDYVSIDYPESPEHSILPLDVATHEIVERPLDNHTAGIAGALSKLTLGEPRSAEQVTLEEHMRKQGWEQGQIDYLGRDSFDNIWKKICTTLDEPDERQPSPAKDVVESEEAVEVSKESETVQEQVTTGDKTTAQPVLVELKSVEQEAPQQGIEQVTASSEEATTKADPSPEKSEILLAPLETSAIAIQPQSTEEITPIVTVSEKGEEIPPVVSPISTSETVGSEVTCPLQTSAQVITSPVGASSVEKIEEPATISPEKNELAPVEKCELPTVVSSEKIEVSTVPAQGQAETPDVCQIPTPAMSEISQVTPAIQPFIPPVASTEESKTVIDCTPVALPLSEIKTDANKPSPVPIQVAESVLASEPKVGSETPIVASTPPAEQSSQEPAVQQQSPPEQATVTMENPPKVTKQPSEEATSEAKPKTARRTSSSKKVTKKTSTESDSAKEDDGSVKREKKKSIRVTKKPSKDEEGTSTSAVGGEPPIPPKRKSKGPKKSDS